jgi:hypothetical protein
VESFGCIGGGAMDLQSIGRKYAGAAAAAFCGGIKHQAPNAALYLASADKCSLWITSP